MNPPIMNKELLSSQPSVKTLGHETQNGVRVEDHDWLNESADVELELPPPPSPEDFTEASSLDTLKFAGEIIDSVRHAADISHDKSQIAVQTVLQILEERYGSSTQFSRYLTSLSSCMDGESPISRVPELFETSTDGKRLQYLFSMTAAWTEDEQQRSWAAREDEGEIMEALCQMHSIILNADHSISKYVMRDDRYRGLQALTLLYQMETRKPIRTKLRDVLISICEISFEAVAILSDSILPMELGREFSECVVSDKLPIMSISKLLTLLMSTGLPFPIGHYAHLGTEFIRSVLKIIEACAHSDETISVELTKLILSYNLQFLGEISNNYTVQALSGFKYSSFFSQRLVNLLNWFEDPLDAGYHKPPGMTNSIVKILIDIFSSPTAAKCFYSNDIDVLVGIIIRWLTDLGPGDRWRPLLLKLVQLTLRHSDYLEDSNDYSRLTACFDRILEEESSTSNSDSSDLVMRILVEFPELQRPEG